jgi:hypothetical protein
MSKWTRRSILVGSAVLAVPVLAFPATKLWCRWRGLPRTNFSQLNTLIALYPESTAVKALGKRYLRQTGESVFASLHRLQDQQQIMGAAKTGCRAQVHAAIEQTCRSEFRVGQFRLVDGWVLAQTELDLAAIQTLA